MNDFEDPNHKLHWTKALIKNTIKTGLRCRVKPKLICYKLLEASYISAYKPNEKRYSFLPLSPEVINKQFPLDEANVADAATASLGKHFDTVLKRTLSYLGGGGLDAHETSDLFKTSATTATKTFIKQHLNSLNANVKHRILLYNSS